MITFQKTLAEIYLLTRKGRGRGHVFRQQLKDDEPVDLGSSHLAKARAAIALAWRTPLRAA